MIQTFIIPNRDYDAIVLSGAINARARNEVRRDYDYDDELSEAWLDDTTPESGRETLDRLYQDKD